MDRILFLLVFLSVNGLAQEIEIYKTDEPDSILNGKTYTVYGDPSTQTVYIDLRVKNISEKDLSLRYRRDRVVGSDQQDQICDDFLCYDANDAPSYTIPNATDLAEDSAMIFKPQFVPNGNSFCAIHDYYVINHLGIKLDSIRIKFAIGVETCELSTADEIKQTTVPSVSIYPNPSGGNVKVKGAKGYSIQVIDVLGKLMHSEEIKNELQALNLSELPDGIYFYSFQNNNGEVLSSARKLVIRK